MADDESLSSPCTKLWVPLMVQARFRSPRWCHTTGLDTDRADTQTFTSWPLGVAVPSSIVWSFVKPLSRDTDGWPNTNSLKAVTTGGQDINARVPALFLYQALWPHIVGDCSVDTKPCPAWHNASTCPPSSSSIDLICNYYKGEETVRSSHDLNCLPDLGLNPSEHAWDAPDRTCAHRMPWIEQCARKKERTGPCRLSNLRELDEALIGAYRVSSAKYRLEKTGGINAEMHGRSLAGSRRGQQILMILTFHGSCACILMRIAKTLSLLWLFWLYDIEYMLYVVVF